MSAIWLKLLPGTDVGAHLQVLLTEAMDEVAEEDRGAQGEQQGDPGHDLGSP